MESITEQLKQSIIKELENEACQIYKFPTNRNKSIKYVYLPNIAGRLYKVSIDDWLLGVRPHHNIYKI